MPSKSRSFAGVTGTSQDATKTYTGLFGGGSETIVWGHNNPESERYGPADSGSIMALTRDITTHRLGYGQIGSTSHRGNVYINGNLPTVPSGNVAAQLSETAIKANGTTAIARTTPTDPIFSMTTFMGETLSDGLPAIAGASLWRERTRVAKASGNEFLNYEFGWLPFVSDLRNFARVVKNHTKILQDFQAGSGKNIRVGYEFPANLKEYASNPGALLPLVGQPSWYWTGGKGSFSSVSSTRCWFKGAFSYHIPVSNDQLSRAIRFEAYANKLLGTRLTPEVVWNLTPWSWAADWFGNAGDIIHNASALGHDGLVLRYGYVMCHNQNRKDYIVSVPNGPTASVSQIVETKQRFPASPYTGFGASAALTTTQTAILAALGMTRGRRG